MERKTFLQTVRYNLSQQKALDNADKACVQREREDIEIDLLSARVNDSIARFQALRSRVDVRSE